MTYTDPQFWAALLTIIGIDIVLSGDNAVVIALASRSLPAHQRKKAIFWGSFAAIAMRVTLTFFAVQLLQFPWLKVVGAVLLFWIGVKLLLPEDASDETIDAPEHLLAAIKTILVADFVMSLDNVVAVAAASKDSLLLLILGLAITIPLIIFSSTILLKLMDRFPIIITIGAALLGYVAGDMLVTDLAVKGWVSANAPWLKYAVPIGGALFVVAAGRLIAKRHAARGSAAGDAAAALEQRSS
jgi:YjbE family integral membrane protein